MVNPYKKWAPAQSGAPKRGERPQPKVPATGQANPAHRFAWCAVVVSEAAATLGRIPPWERAAHPCRLHTAHPPVTEILHAFECPPLSWPVDSKGRRPYYLNGPVMTHPRRTRSRRPFNARMRSMLTFTDRSPRNGASLFMGDEAHGQLGLCGVKWMGRPLRAQLPRVDLLVGKRRLSATTMSPWTEAGFTGVRRRPPARPGLKGATVDFIDELKARAVRGERRRRMPTARGARWPHGPICRRARNSPERQVNPSNRAHGGEIRLVDVREPRFIWKNVWGGLSRVRHVTGGTASSVEKMIHTVHSKGPRSTTSPDHQPGENPFFLVEATQSPLPRDRSAAAAACPRCCWPARSLFCSRARTIPGAGAAALGVAAFQHETCTFCPGGDTGIDDWLRERAGLGRGAARVGGLPRRFCSAGARVRGCRTRDALLSARRVRRVVAQLEHEGDVRPLRGHHAGRVAGPTPR